MITTILCILICVCTKQIHHKEGHGQAMPDEDRYLLLGISWLEESLDTKEKTFSMTLANFRKQYFLKSARFYHGDSSNNAAQESRQLICKLLSIMTLMYRHSLM